MLRVIAEQKQVVIHIINSPYDFSIQTCPQNSDRVQFRFWSPERCIIKHLKNTKLYSIEFVEDSNDVRPIKLSRRILV